MEMSVYLKFNKTIVLLIDLVKNSFNWVRRKIFDPKKSTVDHFD